MTLGLKFLFWKNRNFWSQKTTFRYLCIFNCNKCILVRLWVKVLVSQVWMQSEVTIQKQYNNGKKKQRGTGSKGYRIFRGIGEMASGFSRGLIKNNVEFSRRDQGNVIWNFQGFPTFLKGVTQLRGKSRDEALFCLEFPR